MTPGTPCMSCSMHQKHPPANTAVSVFPEPLGEGAAAEALTPNSAKAAARRIRRRRILRFPGWDSNSDTYEDAERLRPPTKTDAAHQRTGRQAGGQHLGPVVALVVDFEPNSQVLAVGRSGQGAQ